MRISNNMITGNYLYSLNKSLERQNTIQEQLSDGKAIHRASDDPIKAIRALRFNTSIGGNEQYTQNLKDAVSWMDTTDGALQDISSITIRAKELAIKAVSPNPTEGFKAIASEIDGIINQLIQIGNSKLGDRYVFSGQKDKTEPFTSVKDASGKVTHVVYNGDENKLSMVIQPGLADANKDSVNLTGTEVFGPETTAADGNPTVTMFDNLIALRDELMKEPPDLTKISGEPAASTIQGKMDADRNAMLLQQTYIGARMSTYEMSLNLLQNNNTIISADLAANEDLDIPKAIIDAKSAENVYNMALAVGARIMPMSLVDFLK
ncbi:flagellar hook-associated protein FlgL [Anaerospora sp.]|uniref:flagellar hook-associated protein FlgL n=1 Tax=Anaerospora sp. TaxID=1960278 RepID=UPI002896D4B7|nr:flagellar hook-associated protein FlgL [Anaerospora sp.]